VRERSALKPTRWSARLEQRIDRFEAALQRAA
jgi:hypothetical protein